MASTAAFLYAYASPGFSVENLSSKEETGLSSEFPNRHLGRHDRPSNLRTTTIWSAEQEAKLLSLVNLHGTSNWALISRGLGSARKAKQCRERWNNFLRPGINRGAWTEEEDALLVAKHRAMGNHWSAIAAELNGRTESIVKNRWYSTVRLSASSHKTAGGVLRDNIVSLEAEAAAAVGCGVKREAEAAGEEYARRNPKRAAAVRAELRLEEVKACTEAETEELRAAGGEETDAETEAAEAPPPPPLKKEGASAAPRRARAPLSAGEKWAARQRMRLLQLPCDEPTEEDIEDALHFTYPLEKEATFPELSPATSAPTAQRPLAPAAASAESDGCASGAVPVEKEGVDWGPLVAALYPVTA